MEARLGIVCPAGSKELFASQAAAVRGVELVWITYSDERDIAREVAGSMDLCDGVFFAGELPFERSQHVLPESMPVVVGRNTAIDLAVALLQAAEQSLPLFPFSVDSGVPGLAEELLGELDAPADAVHHFIPGPGVTVEQIVAFHAECAHDMGTRFAVTSRSSAVSPLRRALDIPVFVMMPFAPSIRAAINQATLAAVSNRYSEMRFAAALFRILDDGDRLDSQIRQLELAQTLRRSVEFDGAWVEPRLAGADVVVFAHQGLMQRITAHWTTVPVISSLQSELRTGLAVGFGLGSTARGSVDLAGVAVQHAADAGAGTAYLLTGDDIMIGPITAGGSKPLTSVGPGNVQIAKLAQTLGLGVDTVARLVALEREAGGKPVTVSQIAAKLSLTAGSGRRIMRTLRDHDAAALTGQTSTSGPGRPTATYVLRMARALSSDEGPGVSNVPGHAG